MIKSENGHTEMRGTGKDFIYDYVNITQGLAESMGMDTAKEVIPALVAFVLSGIMGDPKVLEKVVSEGAVS